MSRPKPAHNIAARMGRWSASHKKTAIFGWLAFIAIAFAAGGALGTKHLDAAKSGTGESGRVEAVLSDHFKQPLGDGVLIQSAHHTVDDADVPRRSPGRAAFGQRAAAGEGSALALCIGQRRPDIA